MKRPLTESQLLQHLVEGTASATGEEFFRALVRSVASALEVRFAFVTQCTDETRSRVQTLAFWMDKDFQENIEYTLSGTPCENVINGKEIHYPRELQKRFPRDKGLIDWKAESFLGLPIRDSLENILGHLAVFDDKPMEEKPRGTTILQIFAARAGAELERIKADEALQKAYNELEFLKNRLEDENTYLQDEIKDQYNFDEIIGHSRSLNKVFRNVEQVAPTDTTVLILGETGTGKELIARSIHNLSPRKERPLVKVDCGGISTNLIESELFGHEKGAFTGAVQQRIGRFELADGGTIFLDEIGELPMDVQVKLLRVLQEGEFERVGGNKTIKVDVRVISATNRNLIDAIKLNKFREDLYYRINVIPIEIPPLRERKDDIKLLANHFLIRYAKKINKNLTTISDETMKNLLNYSWPGNIRELQNIIERAVVLTNGNELQLDESTFVNKSEQSGIENEALEDLEREHILKVLKKTNWVIQGNNGAASILNLNPSTLRSKIKKLGIKKFDN